MSRAIPVTTGDFSGFAVSPIENCPHSSKCVDVGLCLSVVKGVTKSPCQLCQDARENWLCLQCAAVMCSRYINGHMAEHAEQTSHAVACSFADLSFWCYQCEAYVTGSPEIQKVHRELYLDKFGCYPEQYKADEEDKQIDELVQQVSDSLHVSVEQERNRGVQFVAHRIKSGCAKNIIVLTGAGLSTAAGIPDFRTPGTGLYDNLQKYDIPYPTAIFELKFFNTNPKPFFELCKNFAITGYKPTKCHHFIKILENRMLLLRNYTQNIDGLERKSNISTGKLIECHGTYNTATCQQCNKQFPFDFIKSVLEKNKDTVEIPMCDTCEVGVVKPDIVFFGESLPTKFAFAVSQDFVKCDMLIVIGTSLGVYPVASLVDMVPPDCPRVYVNRERSGQFATTTGPNAEPNGRDFFIGGDIEQFADEVCQLLGWDAELQMARDGFQ